MENDEKKVHVPVLVDAYAHLEDLVARLLKAIGERSIVLSEAERDALRSTDKIEGMILEVGPSWEPSLKVWNTVAQYEGLGPEGLGSEGRDPEGLSPRYAAISVAGLEGALRGLQHTLIAGRVVIEVFAVRVAWHRGGKDGGQRGR